MNFGFGLGFGLVVVVVYIFTRSENHKLCIEITQKYKKTLKKKVHNGTQERKYIRMMNLEI